jgi:anti-sigma-K factor RskA
MNLQSFLQSGLLESYALGHCSPSEQEEVTSMLSQHEEARAELKNIETALEQFAQTQAVAPPDWMKGRIEDLIKPTMSPPPSLPAPEGFATPNTPSSGFNILSMLLGASAIVLGTLFFNSSSKANALETDLEKAKIQLQDCDTQKNSAQKLQQQIAHLSDPNTQKTAIKWLETGVNPDATASVYFNAKTQQAYVSQVGIPNLQANQDYQLWVIVEGNPNPLPLNLLKTDDVLANVNGFSGKAQAFAVSIEPKGGSTTGKPTTVVMLGKVG